MDSKFKITLYHLHYNNISLFMSFDPSNKESRAFDEMIINEFQSVKFNENTSFYFMSSEEELIFFLKYYGFVSELSNVTYDEDFPLEGMDFKKGWSCCKNI